MTRLIAGIGVFAVLCAVAGPARSGPPLARIEGEDTLATRVMIRTIDDGEVLWVGQYRLGTTAAVPPGPHTIGVMCEFRAAWGSQITPGKVSLTAEAGRTYRLTAEQTAGDCRVTVTAN